MKEIIIASNNKGKIKEAQEILNECKIIPMKELGIEVEVNEDKETFVENAVKKAETIANMLDNKMCLADDSGIEIEYLNGFPGVKKRKIKFITALALVDGQHTIVAEASIDGYVAKEPRGKNGFGFDEIFELENGKTLAELPQEEKISLSARNKAFEILKNKLKV